LNFSSLEILLDTFPVFLLGVLLGNNPHQNIQIHKTFLTTI